MGFGRIGKILIKRCLGFDMSVNVYDPFVDKTKIFWWKKLNLNLAFKTADFCQYICP